MRVSQIKLGAVINLGEYSDLRPEVTVDLDAKDTPEEAREAAREQIAAIWNSTNNQQLAKNGSNKSTAIVGERVPLKCYVSGVELLYDAASHTYVDAEGNSYISGSKFAHSFGYEFNKAAILPAYAERNGVKEYEVDDYWNDKSLCSTTWGTAVHQAIATYGTHKKLADKLSKDTGVHPLLLPIVESFFETHKGNYVFEKFVADTKTTRCGQIDTIELTGNKKCVLRDNKTNGDLHKQGKPKFLKAPYSGILNTPFGEYTLQLNFYRSIMEAAGWEVEAMFIDHLTHKGEWKEVEVPKVKIGE